MDLLIHNKYGFKPVLTLTIDREYFLKGEASGEIYSSIEDEDRDEPNDKERLILCAECSQAITGDSERIEKSMAHTNILL